MKVVYKRRGERRHSSDNNKGKGTIGIALSIHCTVLSISYYCISMQAPPPTDQAEAPIPPETGSNNPIPPETGSNDAIPPETGSNDANMNRSVKLRRKAANRTEPLYLRRGTRKRHSPRYFESSPPQAEDIPAVARKKPRLEESLPTTIDKAAIKKVLPDVSEGYSPSAADDGDDDDTNADADPVSDTQANAMATGNWTPEEDAKLTRAVATTSKKKWGKEYKTDWIAIAVLVPGRTKNQCRCRWHDVLDPNIALAAGREGKWTADEDSKLKDAVQTHGAKNWAAISALVPSRTKKQCSSRWHDALNPSIGRATGCNGKWIAVEDSKLKDAVQTHGAKNWAAISALIPSRTKKQCYNRWHGVLHPSIDRATGCNGKWIAVEDSKLKDAVHMHGGKNWKEIALLVPGRTKQQCCDRWHDALDPSIDRTPPGRTGKWAEDEDSKLKDAVQTHGGKDWAAIASLVPGRVEKQCWSRWHDVLDPSIDRESGRSSNWTAVEDSKLKDAVQMHGGKDWAAITALVPGRTRTQCRSRWQVLQRSLKQE
jgi:hypothetical protein